MKALYDIVKRFEGCHERMPDGRLKAYKCPAGIWTCGWGSTGHDVNQNTVWTQAEADKRLEDDLTRFVAGVLKTSPKLADQPNKLAAVASFAYNVGIGAYQGSTMRKHIDAGAWDLAAGEFQRWNKAGGKVLPGLTKRRAAERQLFVS